MSYLVYKLYCKDTSITDVYIGSTKNFNNRKIKHKSNCNNENTRQYNFKLYVFIRNNGGWDNWDFEIIEENIQDKVQALVREKYYIQLFSSSLNCYSPFRTEEEFKEYHKEQNKEYREKNEEKFKEYHKKYFKEYREKNKEEIKERDKEYYEQNKEKIKQQHKEYYEQNKEKINEKITCDICGSISTRNHIARHKKSKKCINSK